VNGSEVLISPGKELVREKSADVEDSAWDAFLETTAQGHFQQSSIWARAKSADGWRPIRRGITSDGQLVGGFQLLYKRSRFGGIGYVSRGPALMSDDPQLVEQAFGSMVATSRANRLRAVVLQAPDEANIPDEIYRRFGFIPNHLTQVVTATLIIPVDCGMKAVTNRMRRTTVVELKRSKKRGIKIREGTEKDLGTFFRLMEETCKRQETAPSPGTESALRAVWDAFHPQNRVRLTIAEYQGEPVAGFVCLCFGDRVTFWKKGWSGAHRDMHPNQAMMFEAIQWAQANGFKKCDCLAMNRSTAMSLMRNETLTDRQKQGRDFFLLGYGGQPTLLPESRIYIRNGLAAYLYGKVIANPRLRTRVQGLLRVSSH
jgi:lipid II:glycine glycyltransferase (peptidoglycan interpeptide bridge formation enzyme)